MRQRVREIVAELLNFEPDADPVINLKQFLRRDENFLGVLLALTNFPLTIYLLSGWLTSRYPGIDLLSHNSGHLLQTLVGWKGDPHFNPIHLFSDGLIASGFIVLSAAWKVLFKAQQAHEVATGGPYARVRHPQYAGFMLIMLGFLIQWPTLITLIMFPILVTMYVRLARREERESLVEFGEAYAAYAASTPAFFPRLSPADAEPAPSNPHPLEVSPEPHHHS